MMRKFYQQKWFGIDFKSFVKLDSGRVADKSFYDKFYDEFYKRYKSYEDALITLLNCIKDYGVKMFLLVSASIYDGGFAPLRLIKDTIKLMLSLIGLYELGQFWGYMRTPDEFTKAFKEAGFEKIEMGFIREGIFWIKGEI